MPAGSLMRQGSGVGTLRRHLSIERDGRELRCFDLEGHEFAPRLRMRPTSRNCSSGRKSLSFADDSRPPAPKPTPQPAPAPPNLPGTPPTNPLPQPKSRRRLDVARAATATAVAIALLLYSPGTQPTPLEGAAQTTALRCGHLLRPPRARCPRKTSRASPVALELEHSCRRFGHSGCTRLAVQPV